jgi:hypothetical protein
MSNRIWLTIWVTGLALYSLTVSYLYPLPEVRFFVGNLLTSPRFNDSGGVQ